MAPREPRVAAAVPLFLGSLADKGRAQRSGYVQKAPTWARPPPRAHPRHPLPPPPCRCRPPRGSAAVPPTRPRGVDRAARQRGLTCKAAAAVPAPAAAVRAPAATAAAVTVAVTAAAAAAAAAASAAVVAAIAAVVVAAVPAAAAVAVSASAIDRSLLQLLSPLRRSPLS